MKTGNKTTKAAKLFAIDQRMQGQYINHNGRTESFDYWRELCQMSATRTGKALRVAERKWMGRILRARLLCFPMNHQNPNQ